jgi:hypothetical protein
MPAAPCRATLGVEEEGEENRFLRKRTKKTLKLPGVNALGSFFLASAQDHAIMTPQI